MSGLPLLLNYTPSSCTRGPHFCNVQVWERGCYRGFGRNDRSTVMPNYLGLRYRRDKVETAATTSARPAHGAPGRVQGHMRGEHGGLPGGASAPLNAGPSPWAHQIARRTCHLKPTAHSSPRALCSGCQANPSVTARGAQAAWRRGVLSRNRRAGRTGPGRGQWGAEPGSPLTEAAGAGALQEEGQRCPGE